MSIRLGVWGRPVTGTVVGMSDLLLAEELFLLVLDDEKGTTAYSVLEPELAGALLLDLIAAGCLVETSGELHVDRDRSAPSHPLLAEALNAVCARGKPKKPKYWVGKLPKKLKPIKVRVAASLVSRGVLDEKRHNTLGLMWTTRYPQADPRPKRELSARLEATLLQGAEPDPRTARLVVLIGAMGLVPSGVPKDQRKAVAGRAEAMAESSAVGAAVKRALEV